MTKYLVSTDEYLVALIQNRDNKYFFIENISEVCKAVELWAEHLCVEVDYDSIEVDFTLQTVKFMWDTDYNGEEYFLQAEWKLIEIEKL